MKNKASLLRQLFGSQKILRIVGAHDGLGAKLIEKNNFDGVWASGLEVSAAHAVPDANILTMTEFLSAATLMNEATRLPVICDCDTGFGNASNVRRMVQKYEAANLAAVVIEDKIFPKVNSFIPGRQALASIEEFMGKIEAAKNAQTNPDFMVFARVEALIAGWGMAEALRRAYAYAEAGADGLVIHSKAQTPDEIFDFAEKWKGTIPLIVIPTTFYSVKTRELASRGIRMVIYANQGLRASIRAMEAVFKTIYETDSTAAVENEIAPLKQVFELQGMAGLREDEEKFFKTDRLQAVIAAAGDHRFQSDLKPLLNEKPLCMLDLGGRSLLDRQADSLRSCGVSDIAVVGGYLSGKIHSDGMTLLDNPRYAASGSAYSILCAREKFKNKCVFLYSDIVFDRNILEQLLKSPHAVTLVIDRAYRTLPFREKKLDLVIAQDISGGGSPRKLDASSFRPIQKIGRDLNQKSANYEFIGMAFFREEGLKSLTAAWARAQEQFKERAFYESPSVEKADFNDLIQYLIDSGQAVHGLEIEHGWSEIHSREDYERVRSYFQQHARTVSLT